MLRIISEETFDLHEELSSCFIEWQKTFDHVNWFKLMRILKETSINWRKRRLISELYMDYSVEVQMNQGETRSVKIGRGVVRQGCYLSLILFNFYSKYLAKAAIEGFGDFQIGGQIICTMKYTAELVLLARGKMVAKGMIENLIEIGRCYGIKMDVENN
jgi:hypothetical protein